MPEREDKMRDPVDEVNTRSANNSSVAVTMSVATLVAMIVLAFVIRAAAVWLWNMHQWWSVVAAPLVLVLGLIFIVRFGWKAVKHIIEVWFR